MEKYFGNAYRGDPGIPHCNPGGFSSIWIGSVLFSAITWNEPYMWNITPAINWHDKAMLYEQYHWNEARKKGKNYKFLWNKKGKKLRDSYYFNWPIYFK